jgi:hypothetical protein
MSWYIDALIFVAAVWGILAAFQYMRSMLLGKAKPNRVTWLMWSVSPMIAAIAAAFNGAGLAAVPVFITGLSPLLVFLASFAIKDSYWRLGRFDYACCAFSVLALALWAVTQNPNVAIAFAIASDGSAAIPTIAKTFGHPESESVGIYVFSIFSAIVAMLAAKSFDFSSYAFPVYIVVLSVLLTVLICRKRIML